MSFRRASETPKPWTARVPFVVRRTAVLPRRVSRRYRSPADRRPHREHHPVVVGETLRLFGDVVGDRLGGEAERIGEWADRRELVGDGGVVAPTANAGMFFPGWPTVVDWCPVVGGALELRCLTGSVVLHGGADEIVPHTEVRLRLLGERGREAVEEIEVGFRFPTADRWQEKRRARRGICPSTTNRSSRTRWPRAG